MIHFRSFWAGKIDFRSPVPELPVDVKSDKQAIAAGSGSGSFQTRHQLF